MNNTQGTLKDERPSQGGNGTPFKHMWEFVRACCRHLRTGWGALTVLSGLGLCSLVVKNVMDFLHATGVASELVGWKTTAFVLIQNSVIFAGMTVLLVFCLVRLGAEREARKIDGERYNEEKKALEQKHKIEMEDQKRKSMKRRLLYCRFFHRTAHLTRNLIARPPKDAPTPSSIVGTLIQQCNFIAAFFNTVFENRFHFRACVKVIVSDTHVVTIARDVKSANERSSSHDSRFFRIDLNSAFLILRDTDQKIFTFDNLHDFPGRYRNESPDWKENYNATAVVPIRKSCVDGGERFELVGFLCLDCMTTGKEPVFAHPDIGVETVRELLLGYADNMFALLKQGKAIVITGNESSPTYVYDHANFPFLLELHKVFVKHDWRFAPTFHSSPKNVDAGSESFLAEGL